MSKKKINIKKNRIKSIDNLFIVLIMWGWLILNNYLALFNINISLYIYLLIISPVYIYMLIKGVYKKMPISGLFLIMVLMATLVYFLNLGSIYNNLGNHTKYYANMLHISVFVLPLLLLNIDKLDLYFYQLFVYNSSKIFIILAFINIASKKFINDSRFLDGNITSFLVAQFIIIYYFREKRDKFDKLIMIFAVVTLLACGTRSGVVALSVVLILLMFKQKSKIKIVYSTVIITIIYIIGYNIYYKLINIHKLTMYLRPLGVLFFDQSNILNKASIGRIHYLSEYIDKITDSHWNLLFGLGPNSFSNYSHNLIVDLIGFGGVFILIIYSIILLYLFYRSERNLIYYQFIFFSIAFLFTSSIFLNSIYFSLMLIMFCKPKRELKYEF